MLRSRQPQETPILGRSLAFDAPEGFVGVRNFEPRVWHGSFRVALTCSHMTHRVTGGRPLGKCRGPVDIRILEGADAKMTTAIIPVGTTCASRLFGTRWHQRTYDLTSPTTKLRFPSMKSMEGGCHALALDGICADAQPVSR